MSGHEFVGPPISRAGPVEEISPKRSLLSKVGQGLISFARDIPVPQLEIEQSQRDIAAGQAELTQQEIEANQAQIIRQQRQQQLSTAAFSGGPESDAAAAQLAVEFPEIFEQIAESTGLRTQGQKNEAADFALRLRNTPFEDRQPMINERINKLVSEGRDPQHTASMTGQSEEDQNNIARVTELLALSPEDRLKQARGGGASKLGQSIVTKDPSGALSFATPVLGPEGQVVTQVTPIPGQVVSRTTGETGPERQVRDIETAGGRATAVSVSKRDQDFINVGQRQADATAIIRRGLELLKTMETGTLKQAQLAGRNLLGIAGADETELNANLGKAVLAQLRSTFGAQFTEREGVRLEGVEAGFGKSTAGNIRLLKQTLKDMERDARRGIDVARRQVPADEFSAAEIESALKFTLTPPEEDALDPALLEFMTPEQRALFEQ